MHSNEPTKTTQSAFPFPDFNILACPIIIYYYYVLRVVLNTPKTDTVMSSNKSLK